ncbi:MAG: hypothetical protein CVV07_01030 [Gammaproteobacteria bacterium HGW-Gammaproteobacteria-11]|nr:MAG: hypothetical protein CVV07_01030 [Gammaproteobacteria bacterium HGW-Gammaproteobacteria-11]
MAILTTFGINSASGGVANPYLSSSHDLFSANEIVGWPPFESVVSDSSPSELLLHFPVSAASRPISVIRSGSYRYDFYDRIHIDTTRVDLGNLVSIQVTALSLWNAHLETRNLVELTGLVEGLELIGQPTPPLEFAALQEREYELSVSPEGESVVDTLVRWVFANGEEVVLRVTANRIVAWSFVPDWGDGVKESLEFLTDVLASESLVEQRRGLRTAPRREFKAPMFVEGRDRQMLDLALFGWGSRVWALPIWPDIQFLKNPLESTASRIDAETEYLDFVTGGLAMLRGESAREYEVVEIDSIDSTGIDLKRPLQQSWPAGTRLYPARPAQLMRQPETTRLTDQLDEAEVQFLLLGVSDWPALTVEDLPTYRAQLVYDDRPDESEDLTRLFQRSLITLDSRTGPPLVTDVAGRAMPVTGFGWLEMGRAQRARYRSLLYTLAGKRTAVWIPTHADDLTLVNPASDAEPFIDVAHVGYTRFGQARVGRRDIRVELFSGEIYYRRINSSSEISSDVERLFINEPLGLSVNPEGVKRICWLVLSRGASDTSDIDHMADSEGLASAQIVFMGVADDVI